jgi:hypothetical protein
MADVAELFLLTGRLQRLLEQAAPRIEPRSEYQYLNIMGEYIGQVGFLRTNLLADMTIDVAGAVSLLSGKLPKVEVLAYNREWQGVLDETYDFLALSDLDLILAAASPLPGTPPSKPRKPPRPRG